MVCTANFVEPPFHAVRAPALERGYAASGNSFTLACFWNFDFGTGLGTRIRALSASFCVKFWACRKRSFLVHCLNAGYAPKYLVTEFSEVRLTFV